jgi:hypothetical protein
MLNELSPIQQQFSQDFQTFIARLQTTVLKSMFDELQAIPYICDRDAFYVSYVREYQYIVSCFANSLLLAISNHDYEIDEKNPRNFDLHEIWEKVVDRHLIEDDYDQDTTEDETTAGGDDHFNALLGLDYQQNRQDKLYFKFEKEIEENQLSDVLFLQIVEALIQDGLEMWERYKKRVGKKGRTKMKGVIAEMIYTHLYNENKEHDLDDTLFQKFESLTQPKRHSGPFHGSSTS